MNCWLSWIILEFHHFQKTCRESFPGTHINFPWTHKLSRIWEVYLERSLSGNTKSICTISCKVSSWPVLGVGMEESFLIKYQWWPVRSSFGLTLCVLAWVLGQKGCNKSTSKIILLWYWESKIRDNTGCEQLLWQEVIVLGEFVLKGVCLKWPAHLSLSYGQAVEGWQHLRGSLARIVVFLHQ